MAGWDHTTTIDIWWNTDEADHRQEVQCFWVELLSKNKNQKGNQKYPVWDCQHSNTHHQGSWLEVAVGLFYFQQSGCNQTRGGGHKKRKKMGWYWGKFAHYLCDDGEWCCRKIINHMGNTRNGHDSVMSGRAGPCVGNEMTVWGESWYGKD